MTNEELINLLTELNNARTTALMSFMFSCIALMVIIIVFGIMAAKKED